MQQSSRGRLGVGGRRRGGPARARLQRESGAEGVRPRRRRVQRSARRDLRQQQAPRGVRTARRARQPAGRDERFY